MLSNYDPGALRAETWDGRFNAGARSSSVAAWSAAAVSR